MGGIATGRTMSSQPSGLASKLLYVGVAGALYMTRNAIKVALFGSDNGDPWGTNSTAPVVVTLSSLLGFHLKPIDVAVIAAGVAVWGFVMGVASRELLRDKGFNRVVNGWLASAGLVFGGAVWVRAIGAPGEDRLLAMAIFAVLCSCAFLFLAALAKAFLLDEAESFAVGVETKTGKMGRKLAHSARRDARVERIVSRR
ncbi:MAG: hypothetical protein KGI57_12070 [Hyphomicrobiales bacterium]|nr:hypothetical protein [Hyphomicrobiales bacterium]MDE2018425.1 hypothetical protein [Hyphomicrobiales bacterium]